MAGIARAGAWLLAIVVSSGCADVRSKRTVTPLATDLPAVATPYRLPRLFREGDRPTTEVIPVARISAHGSCHATREDLEARLLDEGAAVGADYVLVTNEEVIKKQIIVQQGRAGLLGFILEAATGSSSDRLGLHGVACRRATASLGAVVAPNGEVQYVRSESPAEKAGLEEGMKVLAVNEKFIQTDEFFLGREIFCRKPGEVLQLDVATPNSGKVRMAVMLEEPPQDAMLASDESSAKSSPPAPPHRGSRRAQK